ncbi:MAG: hypothetical protein ACT4O0_10050 [Pseudonocardia sp.]
MAGIINRIKAFLRSPRGQQMVRDPRNRQKAKDMWNRRGGRGGGHR